MAMKKSVTPDDVLLALDGNRTVRKIMTGRSRKDDEKKVAAAAFLMAATEACRDTWYQGTLTSGNGLGPRPSPTLQ